MRVIGGKYRGKRLISPKDGRIRPTTDMVKENIFNIIQPYVQDAVFLDLFSGSGAIGIEALSRGAKEVIFVDNDKDSMAVVDSNLKVVGIAAPRLLCDYRIALERLQNKAFDIIFIDAPYKADVIGDVMNTVLVHGMLNNDGVIVYESSYDSSFKADCDNFELIKTKKYGSVAIYIYKKASAILPDND